MYSLFIEKLLRKISQWKFANRDTQSAEGAKSLDCWPLSNGCYPVGANQWIVCPFVRNNFKRVKKTVKELKDSQRQREDIRDISDANRATPVRWALIRNALSLSNFKDFRDFGLKGTQKLQTHWEFQSSIALPCTWCLPGQKRIFWKEYHFERGSSVREQAALLFWVCKKIWEQKKQDKPKTRGSETEKGHIATGKQLLLFSRLETSSQMM